MLSLGYWGERVGFLMFSGPSEIEVVDPQAMAEQQAALSELEAQTHTLRQAIARNEDIANERQLRWALEQTARNRRGCRPNYSDSKSRQSRSSVKYKRLSSRSAIFS